MADEHPNPNTLNASENTPAVRKSVELGGIPKDHPRANGAPSASINDPEYRAAALAVGGVTNEKDENTVEGWPVEVFKDVDPVLQHRPAVQGDAALTSGDLHKDDVVYGSATDAPIADASKS